MARIMQFLRGASVGATQLDGLFFLICMLVGSLFVISVIIFSCGDHGFGKSKKQRTNRNEKSNSSAVEAARAGHGSGGRDGGGEHGGAPNYNSVNAALYGYTVGGGAVCGGGGGGGGC